MPAILKSIEPVLIRAYRSLSDPPEPNLRGDRDVEFSWIAGKMPSGPGKAIDFGSGDSYMGLVAARRGFEVLCLDLTKVSWFYEHPDVRFEQTDLFAAGLAQQSVDLIINCSAIEHVGLKRYGGEVESDRDLKAMNLLRDLLKPTGTMVLTTPVGEDAVFPGMHRVYGRNRLGRLLSGYDIKEQEFWVKNSHNRWVLAPEEQALSRPPQEMCYGLGCFVLTVGAQSGERP
jgi:hypothetical protein